MAIYSNVFLTSLFHFEYIYYTNTFKTRIGKGQCVCVFSRYRLSNGQPILNFENFEYFA